MSEIVLTIVIALLLGFIAYLIHEHKEEKAKLVHALLAKTPTDMVNMTLADQTKIEVPKQDNPADDLIDAHELSDEKFDQFIKGN